MKKRQGDTDRYEQGDQPHRGPYGQIPNSIVLDPRLSASGLAMLAYRLTKVGKFSLSQDAAAIGLPLSDGSKGRKIGRSKFKRSTRELKRLGYLKRSQRASKGRSSFSYAEENVHLPDVGGWARICREWWHDGSLTEDAIVALVFIRAFNCPIALDVLRKRFKWGKQRARKAVTELFEERLIVRLHGGKHLYRDAEVRDRSTSEKATSDSPSHETPSDDRQSYTRTDRTPRNDQGHKKNPSQRTRSYDSAAKASDPEPFPREKEEASEGLSGLVDPWENEKILGWAKHDKRDLVARLSCDELSRDTLAEVESLASDEQLLEMLQAACGGRVHPEVLSPAGAEAVRLLTAVLVEDKRLTPEHALKTILAFVENCIGGRAGRWLNSLKLVGLRVAGSIAAGEQGLHSDTREMLSALGKVDFGNVLSPHLFRQPRQFKQLIKQYGEDAFDIIRTNIIRASMESKESGSIGTWNYFEPALKDERLRRSMAEEGVRPGDIFGQHRNFCRDDEPC